MADSITSLITANVVTSVAAITTANHYNTNVAYCEQERLSDRTNNRYPRVEVLGPAITINRDQGQTQADSYELEYTLLYKAKLSDDAIATEEPIPQQTDNVAPDLIKGIMADHTRGGYAITTEPTETYYTIDIGPDGEALFMIVLTFKVITFVDFKDPYVKG
jgi:hypothetical protein